MGSTPSKEKPNTAEGWSKRVNDVDKIKIPACQWQSIPILPCESPISIYDYNKNTTNATDTTGTPNVYTVQSCFPVMPFVMSLPCTMTIYRDSNGDVTLFNVFRVSEKIEDEILKIGPVKHIVKLGAFHGAADAYYLKAPKFGNPKYWCLNGMRCADGLSKPSFLTTTSVPIDGAVLHTLPEPFPEACMIVPGVNGDSVLIVADTLVHATDTKGVPLIGKVVMNLFGLATDGVPQVAPVWYSLESDALPRNVLAQYYEKLWSLEWNSVVTGHGRGVVNVDRDKVKVVVDRKLAETKVPTTTEQQDGVDNITRLMNKLGWD